MHDTEALQQQIHILTQRLKSISSTDPAYQQVWNQRAELKSTLRSLESRA